MTIWYPVHVVLSELLTHFNALGVIISNCRESISELCLHGFFNYIYSVIIRDTINTHLISPIFVIGHLGNGFVFSGDMAWGLLEGGALLDATMDHPAGKLRQSANGCIV